MFLELLKREDGARDILKMPYGELVKLMASEDECVIERLLTGMPVSIVTGTESHLAYQRCIAAYLELSDTMIKESKRNG